MRRSPSVCIVVACSAAIAAASSSAAMVAFPAVADTYLRSSANDANEGIATFLRVRSGPNRTLVRFDQGAIAGAASGMVLLSAQLQLFV